MRGIELERARSSFLSFPMLEHVVSKYCVNESLIASWLPFFEPPKDICIKPDGHSPLLWRNEEGHLLKILIRERTSIRIGKIDLLIRHPPKNLNLLFSGNTHSTSVSPYSLPSSLR